MNSAAPGSTKITGLGMENEPTDEQKALEWDNAQETE